ncbi:MAG TPA: hypothetical protein VLU46_12785 [Thermoanaerobaculia bacterium]|nr:hypothetical protein [Thermoanaerobaculia bacterium]
MLSIRKGSVIVYRIFDIAEEIDLAAVESVLQAGPGTSRLSLARPAGHALVVRNAPVTLSLGTSPVRVGAQQIEAELFARLWDYGVISVQFHLPLTAGTSWPDLVRLAAAAEDDSDFDEVARVRGTELRGALSAALVEPHEPHGLEDYIVYLLEQIDGIRSPSDLLDAADVPALILGEPSTSLSPRLRKPIIESTFQYSTDDMAVIDWNSALVIEPGGSRDVADMLEFAATHLTEFRYFDELLDIKLDQLYTSIDKRRVTVFRRDYESLSREAGSLYIEFSEFVERVENSLKFVGDFYLATIFRAAVARFNLREWEENVSRKMRVLTNVSEVLKNEVDVSRSHWLEIIVIVLIVFEIVSAILKVA